MRKYTKELLAELVKGSVSIAQVIRKLNLKEAGGTHSHISRKIKEYDLDTSHFLGQGYRKGMTGGPTKRTAQEILVERTEGKRQASYRLRRALIEIGREYKCEKCGLKSEWNGKELRLQVNHKDGNWLDDRQENLEFVCPNCHSQTNNFCGTKGLTEVTRCKASYKKKKRRGRGKKLPYKGCEQRYVCLECGEYFWPKRKVQKYCSRKCCTKNSRKTKRPTKEQLEQEIKENSWLALGRKYGVSDNAVRKWAKAYEL